MATRGRARLGGDGMDQERRYEVTFANECKMYLLATHVAEAADIAEQSAMSMTGLPRERIVRVTQVREVKEGEVIDVTKADSRWR